MTERLLYNVSAFMRPDQKITVLNHRDRHDDWPIHVQIGPGVGGDTIDIHASVANATRLRDALTAALDGRAAVSQ